MRTSSTHDFGRRRPQPDEPKLYDLEFDALLIEQSIATQYGILPAAQGEIPYTEWVKLVSGLMDDTPLGRVVAVRAEEDRKVIAKMTPWQRRIRAEWNAFLVQETVQRQSTAELRAQMDNLERAMARMFGG